MDACNSNPTLPLQDYAHHHGMARRQNYSPRVQRQRVPRARLTEAFRAPTPARSAIIESTLPSRPQASRSRQHATSASRPYPYYPPRRPIQRSLFADRQLPEVEPMPLELSDSQIPSPSSSYLHTARANPGISLRPDSFSSPSPVHQSPSPAARALLDHTLFNLYAGLARLQSAWSSALNREKKEKEVLRAYCLKLQRERDIVLEQTCEIEERQTPAVSYSVVTAGDEYSRTYSGENGSIQLPIPHARCSLALTNVDEASQCGSVRNGSLTLVYPSGSSVSPSPPPPPISGRQFLFSPSEENLSNSLPTPPPTSVFSTKNSNKRARSSSSCSSRSEQEESSAVAQASGDGGISPSPNSNGSDGECDMDISDNDSSDSETNDISTYHLRSGQAGKKLLFDDNPDEVSQKYPYTGNSASPSSASGSTSTAIESHQIPSLNLRDLNRMYFKFEGLLHCRTCRTTDRHCLSPLPPVNADRPDLDVLMDHCTQHPVVAGQIFGLTLDQVFHLQKLLKAHMLAGPIV